MNAMNTTKLYINRPNGTTEVVDVTGKFAMSAALLAKIKAATRAAGKGDVVRCEIERRRSNFQDLYRRWNNIHNEGGAGWTPDEDYFRALPEYREWTDVEVIEAK